MKTCKYCKEQINKTAKRCPKCQGDLRSWIAKHPILTILLVVFGLIVVNSGGDKSKTTEPVKTEVKSTEKLNIVVTSQIVKKVDGKHRYFFDIRNKDTKNFEGSVTITLYNELGSNPLGGDTFKTKKAIEPELGTSEYIDINTGPVKVHGANGVSKFKYVVKKDNQIVNEGEGTISEKYEDLN